MTNSINIKIQKATIRDLDDICELEQICFKDDAFTKQQFNYLLKKAKGEFVVVRKNKKLIAYLIFLKRKNSKKYRIYSIAIAPEARGLGIASQLLDYTELRAKKNNIHKIALEVSENNHSAIKLYKKQNYQTTGYRSGYYADGSNAIIMLKEF